MILRKRAQLCQKMSCSMKAHPSILYASVVCFCATTLGLCSNPWDDY